MEGETSSSRFHNELEVLKGDDSDSIESKRRTKHLQVVFCVALQFVAEINWSMEKCVRGVIDFSKEQFAPPIRFPSGIVPHVLDLSSTQNLESFGKFEYSIGKYMERRVIYTTDLFKTERSPRFIHLGIDLGAPLGTPVFVPFRGKVLFRGFNPAPGDYGYCVITEHFIQGVTIFFLFGHLGKDAMLLEEEQIVETNQVLAHLGAKDENGGW